MRLLAEGTRAHRLVLSDKRNSSVLAQGQRDPVLAEAEIAFGQPDPADCLDSRKLRWIEVSSAGYTRYDTPGFREGMRTKGTVFTNASQVYTDACSEHVLAMMLALGRQLLASYAGQLGKRDWPYDEPARRVAPAHGPDGAHPGVRRDRAPAGRTARPFNGKIYAVRRQIHSEKGVHIVPEADLTKVLGEADHVVNILPENQGTKNYVNARRIACFKRGAYFYNIGRGATVDQDALIAGLQSGAIGAAYLDVTVPEPLPPNHPLWSAPHCFITPHTAGGRHGVNLELVRHFLANLAAFAWEGAMTDRIL